jgi:RNA polymerase sigma factor (sigma-70 family)
MKITEQNKEITEEQLINGIINDDPFVINYIYRKNFDRIKSMVTGFKNINLDADDVFQEGLTRAIINVKKGKFKANSTFATYIYGICRNICLKEYEKNKNTFNFTKDEIKEITEEDNYFDVLQQIIILKNKLDEKCKKIINLRFGINYEIKQNKMMRFDIIARILNITADNARQKFSRCLAKLKKLVSEANIFND